MQNGLEKPKYCLSFYARISWVSCINKTDDGERSGEARHERRHRVATLPKELALRLPRLVLALDDLVDDVQELRVHVDHDRRELFELVRSGRVAWTDGDGLRCGSVQVELFFGRRRCVVFDLAELAEERLLDVFPYLETDAQWACFTLRDQRKRALDRIEASYPKGKERDDLVAAYEKDGRLPDGSDVFVRWAKAQGWFARLRKDLSGCKSVETDPTDASRVTVVTARGSRYTFRRRENGIWGLTMVTAELVAEAEKASRDLDVVSCAADDYDNAKKP